MVPITIVFMGLINHLTSLGRPTLQKKTRLFFFSGRSRSRTTTVDPANLGEVTKFLAGKETMDVLRKGKSIDPVMTSQNHGIL